MPVGATETGLGAVTAHGWGMGSGSWLAGLLGLFAGLGWPAAGDGLLGRGWGAMHQFCAAGLEGLGGFWRAGGYVGSGCLAGGPSGPVSGPWRAIAGCARLVAGCEGGRNDCFHCTTTQYWGFEQYSTGSQHRAKPGLSVHLASGKRMA